MSIDPKIPSAKVGAGLRATEAATRSSPLQPEEPSEDTDGRGIFNPSSKYEPRFQRQQAIEGGYIAILLFVALFGLCFVGLEFLERWLVERGTPTSLIPAAERYGQLVSAGLLGGTVYGAKWLYHSVAKGLWHEDRRVWRYLAPWISVGTTVGIWALIDSGLFRVNGNGSELQRDSATSVVGWGFLIGYLSDMFLAKMKELTTVLFGRSEHHHSSSSSDREKP